MPHYPYSGCIEACLTLGVVPGVSAVPRVAKRALETIGGSSIDLPFVQGSSPKATRDEEF